jgi:GH15 family glucan-1,4-alpha-glucosidase
MPYATYDLDYTATTMQVDLMARPIVLSNGELHVGLNTYGLVHDFYYPYVGLENHSAGPDLRHRVGIWVDGSISWLDDEGQWSITFHYPHGALVGHTLARNEGIGILLEFDDFVDSSFSAFMRNIHIVNLREQSRDIRLFMHQAFDIGDSKSNTDTAQYLPDSNALLHYRGRRAFIISGTHNDQPFDQYTVGLFGIEGHESTYRDADDGELGFGTVEHGRVDSIMRFKLDIQGHSSERVHYWIAAGKSIREALYVHKLIREKGLQHYLHSTASWWHTWLQPAQDVARRIAPSHRDTFLQSVMILKSQMDNHGAVIASTDTTMLNYSRDAYTYAWPRDGAYVLWPLIRMGYKEEAYRFFNFCKRGMHASGYLIHKYRADGALGSSWHTYVHDDVVAPPIQEDETALVLFVFAQFYQKNPEDSLIKEFYQSMVVPMADFLASYIDEKTGLPRPSYDLWEEIFLTTTYTTAVVHAALIAASDIASAANDADNAVKWRSAAEDILAAAHKEFFNKDKGFFYRGIIVHHGEIVKDDTIDVSSVFGAFMFGLFAPESDEIKTSISTLKNVFSLNDTTIGIPRYENDNYRREADSGKGNPWFITTLWMAQYELEQSHPERAMQILDWTQSLALTTGMLSEQIDPITLRVISPAPLTWSQAEYVSTLLDTITEQQ